MSADLPVFCDTNVLVYLFDTRYPGKQAAAAQALAGSNLVFSAQVLGEFYVTVTRKLVEPLARDVAVATVSELQRHTVVPITAALVTSAMETSARFQVSYWDALIIEAAVVGGCTTVLSEDLTDGQVIRGIRIENPFRDVRDVEPSGDVD